MPRAFPSPSHVAGGVRFAVGIPHSIRSAYTTLLASRSTHGPSFPFLLLQRLPSFPPSYRIKPNHIAIREVFSEHHESLANSFSPLILISSRDNLLAKLPACEWRAQTWNPAGELAPPGDCRTCLSVCLDWGSGPSVTFTILTWGFPLASHPPQIHQRLDITSCGTRFSGTRSHGDRDMSLPSPLRICLCMSVSGYRCQCRYVVL
jgi:hypothetical protein